MKYNINFLMLLDSSDMQNESIFKNWRNILYGNAFLPLFNYLGMYKVGEKIEIDEDVITEIDLSEQREKIMISNVHISENKIFIGIWSNIENGKDNIIHLEERLRSFLNELIEEK